MLEEAAKNFLQAATQLLEQSKAFGIQYIDGTFRFQVTTEDFKRIAQIHSDTEVIFKSRWSEDYPFEKQINLGDIVFVCLLEQ